MVAMQPRQRRARADDEGGGNGVTGVKRELAKVANSVRNGVKTAAGQAKQQLTEMTHAVADTVKKEAEQLFEENKGNAASKVAGVSKVTRQAAHALHAVKADTVAEYFDAAAQRVEKVSDYIKDRSLGSLLEDAEEVAARHEALAVGGLFVAGFLVARFLKASPSQEQEDREPSAADSRPHGNA